MEGNGVGAGGMPDVSAPVEEDIAAAIHRRFYPTMKHRAGGQQWIRLAQDWFEAGDCPQDIRLKTGPLKGFSMEAQTRMPGSRMWFEASLKLPRYSRDRLQKVQLAVRYSVAWKALLVRYACSDPENFLGVGALESELENVFSEVLRVLKSHVFPPLHGWCGCGGHWSPGGVWCMHMSSLSAAFLKQLKAKPLVALRGMGLNLEGMLFDDISKASHQSRGKVRRKM